MNANLNVIPNYVQQPVVQTVQPALPRNCGDCGGLVNNQNLIHTAGNSELVATSLQSSSLPSTILTTPGTGLIADRISYGRPTIDVSIPVGYNVPQPSVSNETIQRVGQLNSQTAPTDEQLVYTYLNDRKN